MPSKGVKKQRYGVPLASSTVCCSNESSFRQAEDDSRVDDESRISVENSEEAIIISDNHNKKVTNPSNKHKKLSIHETPLSSKLKDSPIMPKTSSKILWASVKLKMTDMSVRKKLAETISSESSDSVFKAPLRPAEHVKPKNKRCIVFDDLDTDDDSIDEEDGLKIHRAKDFPSWCNARNLRELKRMQSLINLDGE